MFSDVTSRVFTTRLQQRIDNKRTFSFFYPLITLKIAYSLILFAYHLNNGYSISVFHICIENNLFI